MAYQKDCYITNEPKASQVLVEMCYTNYVRDCNSQQTIDGEPDEECSQEYDIGKKIDISRILLTLAMRRPNLKDILSRKNPK